MNLVAENQREKFTFQMREEETGRRKKAIEEKRASEQLQQSARQVMPFSQLPLELLDHILGQSANDKETLKACSLVCRSFHRAARPYLFNSIDNRTNGQRRWNSTSVDMEQTTEELRQYVKVLTLSCHVPTSRWPTQTFPVIWNFRCYRGFSHLHTLVLEEIDIPYQESSQDPEYDLAASVAMSYIPQLTSLTLLHCWIQSALRLDQIIESAANLKHLTLINVFPSEESLDDAKMLPAVLQAFLQPAAPDKKPRYLGVDTSIRTNEDDTNLGCELADSIWERRRVIVRSLRLFAIDADVATILASPEWAWTSHTEFLLLNFDNKRRLLLEDDVERLSLANARNLTTFCVFDILCTEDNLRWHTKFIVHIISTITSPAFKTIILEFVIQPNGTIKRSMKSILAPLTAYLCSRKLKLRIHFKDHWRHVQATPAEAARARTDTKESGEASVEAWFPSLFILGRVEYSEFRESYALSGKDY